MIQKMFEEKADSPFITVKELTIELTPDFYHSSVESASSSEIFYGDGYRVAIERTAFSSITPYEGYDFPTLIEFMQYYMFTFVRTDEEYVEILQEDDIRYIDADTDYDGEPDTLIVFFESASAYWNIRMQPLKEPYVTAREQCMDWARTVTFTE